VKEERKFSLILGSHAHLPSGSSEAEFEFLYKNRMRPFVSGLSRYSNINAVLHYSGVLLYWIERTHPEFFMLIEDMVARKQIEILGGGFYEPMFTLIPLQDKIGQIELMTTYLRKQFGKRPQGCWIPGMVWEQNLANTLSSIDMNYTFLSQEQFKLAGMKDDDIFIPCIAEDKGKVITIFPVNNSVEKDLSEKSCSFVFNELKKKLDGKHKSSINHALCGKVISVFPEKVSSSPEEPPDTVWNRFFEEISLLEGVLETTLPSKIFKNFKGFKKANFPNSSSLENNFSPRNFIIDHEDANSLYSKMIFTNVLINQLKGDKVRKYHAKEEMWKAQDSFLFSPGDGYLRNDIRKAAFSSLLRAECLSREKSKTISSIIQYDLDFDGIKEYLFQDNRLNCYIMQKGAAIFELDYLPKVWNYLDCGTNEFGRRTAFADILVTSDTKIEELIYDINNFSRNGKGRLCFNETYEAITQERKGKLCFILPATAENILFGCIEISKCFLLRKDNITVSYVLRNTGKDIHNFLFIPKINFSFTGINDKSVRFYSVENTDKNIAMDKLFNASNLKIHDVINEVQIILSSTNDFSGCIVHAFNNSIYQATRILPAFTVSLEPEEIWNNEFSLKFTH